jgi:hypothetical protein
MPLTQTLARGSRALSSPGAAAPMPVATILPGAELARILDDLVDAIDVRESYEPEVSGWDTTHVIRRLERELARAWTGLPRPGGGQPAARRWTP